MTIQELEAVAIGQQYTIHVENNHVDATMLCTILEAQYSTLPEGIRQVFTDLRTRYPSPESLFFSRNLRYWTPDNDQWLTKEGKLPKRLFKAAYEQWQVKLPPKWLSIVGEMIRRKVVEGNTLYVDTTNELDWDAGDFGDSGSCYWGDRAGARQMIPDAGGFAIRIWDGPDYDHGLSRCWCIPDDGVYYIFNAYSRAGHRLETFEYILRQITGWDSVKVELRNHGYTGGVLYINSGNGFAIFPPGKHVTNEHDFDIEEITAYSCYSCGCTLDEDEICLGPDDHDYCGDCFNESYDTCECCGEAFDKDSIHDCHGHYYCESCAHRKDYYPCYQCGEWSNDLSRGADDEGYCQSCWDERFTTCDNCDEVFWDGDTEEYEGEYYCEDCMKEVAHLCHQCKTKLDEDSETQYVINHEEVCQSCYQKWAQNRDKYAQPVLV